jgi:AraC family ethanolamine operon transcriptional activator
MGHEGRINGRRWRREIVAFRGEDEYDALVPPMKLLIVAISRDVVSEYMETVEHLSIKDWLKCGMLLVENQSSTTRMIEAFTAVLDGYCTNPSLLMHSTTRSAVKQAAMEILAPIILQNLNVPSITCREFNRTQIVRRAREFMLENISEPIQIINVCYELGISRRVLQYSFQDLLNINPVTYLRLLRLNGARRDLVNAYEKPLQVKDVVAHWGFWHLSRFSAEYKQIFNELPSQTLLHALRQARYV